MNKHVISWGWVVFWLIMFWPVAIAYILIKQMELDYVRKR